MEIKITINNKLANIIKKVFTKKNSVFALAVILFCAGLVLFSQQVVELDTFHDGDIIYAGPINDNFTALKNRELGSLGDVDASGAANGQVLKYIDGAWKPEQDMTSDPGSGDDMGDHSATQNIQLGTYYLSGDGDDEGIRIDAEGNVGIGTTSPEETLDITGNININNGHIQVDESPDSWFGTCIWSNYVPGITRLPVQVI